MNCARRIDYLVKKLCCAWEYFNWRKKWLNYWFSNILDYTQKNEQNKNIHRLQVNWRTVYIEKGIIYTHFPIANSQNKKLTKNDPNNSHKIMEKYPQNMAECIHIRILLFKLLSCLSINSNQVSDSNLHFYRQKWNCVSVLFI